MVAAAMARPRAPWSNTPAGLVRPGALWGHYPVRTQRPPPWQAWFTAQRVRREQALLLSALQRQDRQPKPLARLVPALRQHGYRPALCAQIFRHLSQQVEQHWGFRPHPEQCLAAWMMLQGCLVEMATGEGKTLATFLAAACAGLAGVPVHVMTANDYLAERDADSLRPLYAAVGLRVACVTSASAPEQRRVAYGADITYAPAREIAFDHLRDRVAHGQAQGKMGWNPAAQHDSVMAEPVEPPLLRGLCMALLDEADSILCDEARVPLILSGHAEGEVSEAALQQLWAWTEPLTLGVHAVQRRGRTGGGGLHLTQAGRQWLAAQAWAAQKPWSDQRWREDWVMRVLTARHLLLRDRDYAVQDAAVMFIDPITGRGAPERQWSRGLQQLLAIKEGLAIPAAQETLAELTYQRLFGRYHHMGGMSGTLAEVGLEMALTYGTPVLPVPRHHPNRCENLGVQVFTDPQARWQRAAERVQALQAQGRAVLLGTSSVAQSQAIAQQLRALGLKPVVLNAVQSQLENDIIARAGQPGRVTVSTQMAGRGTDIPLSPEVRAQGGLHVLICAEDLSGRAWRQLAGRSGRQGDPGSVETLLSVSEGVLFRRLPKWLIATLVGQPLGSAWTRRVWRTALVWDEWTQIRERWALLRQDRARAERMAFSGWDE